MTHKEPWLFLLLFPAFSCASGKTLRTEQVLGEWGGEHIQVVASDTSALVEFDCAHARIDGPIPMDAQGHFEATGLYIPESGAIREGDVPLGKPASFKGRIQEDRMSLTVTILETGAVVGTFELRKGEPAGLYKCL